jgi:hypothetical protein
MQIASQGIVMGIPTGISAAAILITFWDDNVCRLFTNSGSPRGQLLHSNECFARQPNHAPAYIVAIAVAMIAFNLLHVRYFGESEFYFCLVKSGAVMLAFCGCH